MKKNKGKIAVLSLSIITILFSITYAFINQTLTGTKRQVITSGDLELQLDEDENNLMITNALPMYDEVGMIQDAFTFRVINQGSIPINYVLKLEEISVNGGLLRSDVKYGFTKDNEQRIDLVSNIIDNTIDEGLILGNQTIEYSLRLWVKEDVTDISTIQNRSMRFRLSVKMLQLEETEHSIVFNPNGGEVTTTGKNIEIGDTYGELPIPTKEDSKFLGWYTSITGGKKIESTSIFQSTENQTLYARWKEHYKDNTGAPRPVLKDSLIPVTIDSTGTVKKADITEEWYDYNKQVWANAIIPLNKNITYNEGDIIPESNIESYFVWIPRYQYKIFNTGNYSSLTGIEDRKQTIEVEFQSKSDPISSGSTKDSWLTHPAFTSFDSDGFWVGKFESGYKEAGSTTAAQVNSTDSTKLQIKPNVYSWRYITAGNAFKVSYDYNRNLDSHLIKNTEWGAVAYLQHSIYGSRKSVRNNNNSSYKTGYASVTEPTLGYNHGTSIEGNLTGTSTSVTQGYNTTIGYTASTTENISGIYDMAGSAWEYVMGYNMNANDTVKATNLTKHYSDFFTNNKWDKYYDKYYNNSSSIATYNKRILGDATGEMGPFGSVTDPDKEVRYRTSWYNDLAQFVNSSSPWFARGGHWRHGSGSGIFAFNVVPDALYDNGSFRVVLTPIK